VPADEQRAIELVAMATAHVGLPTKPRDDHAHDAKDTMAHPHPVLLTVVAVVVVVAAAVLLVQLPMRQARPDTAEEKRARHLKKCRFRSSFSDATLRLHPHAGSLQASRQDPVNRRSSSSIRVASRLQTLQLHLLLRMASAAIDVGAPRSSTQAWRGMTRQRQLSQTRLDAVLSSLACLGRRALARRP